MKRFYLLLCSCLLMASLNAQTRRIAHKSHSGSARSYQLLLKEKPFAYTTSNFGRSPEKTVRTARLDSVIALGPTVCIMVTRECLMRYGAYVSKWKPGRDTIYNHHLFSRIHSLDSVKHVVQTEYYFQNPVSEVVFIGFDNGKAEKKSKKQK